MDLTLQKVNLNADSKPNNSFFSVSHKYNVRDYYKNVAILIHTTILYSSRLRFIANQYKIRYSVLENYTNTKLKYE